MPSHGSCVSSVEGPDAIYSKKRAGSLLIMPVFNCHVILLRLVPRTLKLRLIRLAASVQRLAQQT